MTLYEKETAHLLCFHHWVRPVYHSTSRYNPLRWRVSARQSVWNRIMQGLNLLKRVMNCACIPFFSAAADHARGTVGQIISYLLKSQIMNCKKPGYLERKQ